MLSYSVYKNEESTKWVTFVHGAGGSSSIWFKQIRAFQNEFNILLIDLRGHGESKTDVNLKKNQKYTFEVVSNDILRSEEHTSELQSRPHLVCRLLLEKKNK